VKRARLRPLTFSGAVKTNGASAGEHSAALATIALRPERIQLQCLAWALVCRGSASGWSCS